MRYTLAFLALVNLPVFGQALRDINYTYLYEPTEPFVLDIKIIKSDAGWTAYYSLVLEDTSQRTDQFLLHWELRSSLEEKQGPTVEASSIEKNTKKNAITGTVKLPLNSTNQYLTLRILNNLVKRVWYFYRPLPANSAANGYLISGGNIVQHPYARINTPITIGGVDETSVVSFYEDDFPAAVPAFSEGMARVSRSMKVDTTYVINTSSPIAFTSRGLYLVQKDSSSKEGFAFRIEEDYPRLTKVESLADPLIYICTKQEFTRVKEAKGDKKAFDRVILSITGNAQRAKEFVRNYYKRVEWANKYFTSYKEGWKTDRGMIYILFGLPDELYKFGDREVWNYKDTDNKVTFNFVRSQTLFDPDNYVLIRDKDFQETWYEKIDLWRNSRF